MTNTLYTNDNLYILHGLNSESVDLIYLDPPFNSKRIYSGPIGSKAAKASFKDMWTWADVNEAYLEKLVDQYPALVSFIESISSLHSFSDDGLYHLHDAAADRITPCFKADR